MAAFELDPRLGASSVPVVDLALCRVRLCRNAHFPWLYLCPARPGVTELIDLDEPDATLLWAEIRAACRVMRALHRPDKLNVAALGNEVAQLHVHVIARRRGDAAWPRPVWGTPMREHDPAGLADAVQSLRHAFAAGVT